MASHQSSKDELAALLLVDPVLALVYAAGGGEGEFRRRFTPPHTPFAALVSTILGQRVSYRAAITFRRRLYEHMATAMGLARGHADLTPPVLATVLTEAPHILSGLAKARAATLPLLIEQAAAKEEADPIAYIRGTEELPGIGRWTVEAALLMANVDCVFPGGDAWLRERLGRLLGAPLTTEKQTRDAAFARWGPRTHLAAKVLWMWPAKFVLDPVLDPVKDCATAASWHLHGDPSE